MKASKILLPCVLLSATIGNISGEGRCDEHLFPTSQVLMTWGSPGNGQDGEPGFKLRIDDKARDDLSGIDSEIAVVSMTGPYGMGKAFLLNALAYQFMGATESSIEVGNFLFQDDSDALMAQDTENKEALTMSIIPGCRNPIPNHEGTTLILIDSLGLSAPWSSNVQDRRLLTALNLLSSVVLYSSLKATQRADMTSLRTAMDAVELLEVLRRDEKGPKKSEEEGSHGGKEEAGELSRPALRWLVQDVDKTQNGNPEGDEYLEGIMKNDRSSGTDKEAFDKFYSDLRCDLLPSPCTDSEACSPLKSMKFADLSGDYKDAMERVKASILTVCSPKKRGDSTVKGESLLTALEELAEVQNRFNTHEWELNLVGKYDAELHALVQVEGGGDRNSAKSSWPNRELVIDTLKTWKERWGVGKALAPNLEAENVAEGNGGEKPEDVVRNFLKESASAAGERAGSVFKRTMEELDDQVQTGEQPAQGKTLRELHEKARCAAQKAEEDVAPQVGQVLARDVAREEAWSESVKNYVRIWRGGKEQHDEHKEATEDKTGGFNIDGFLDQHHKPCLEEIDGKGASLEDSMRECRKHVLEEWEKTGSKEQEDKKALPDKIGQREQYKRAKTPGDEELTNAMKAEMEGVLSKNKSLMRQDKASIIDEVLKPVKEGGASAAILSKATKWAGGYVTKEMEQWKNHCMDKSRDFETQVKQASSIFSLAPMRYSRTPWPMDENDCEFNKSFENLYYKVTLGRRWLLRLLHCLSLMATAVAGTMLVTGRRLQSRRVAIVFVASASLHIVMLCLATSNGLVLGSRLWWLSSSIVLGFASSGGCVGGKRGGAGRRGVWSTTGGRGGLVSNGGVMPLFKAAPGSGATSVRRAKIGEPARYND